MSVSLFIQVLNFKNQYQSTLSLFSGWLGWGGGGSTKVENESLKTKEKQITEPASPVYPKYEISDSLREALSVSVSPNERLAAVTDALGRVTLVDLSRGSALHMWKGRKKSTFIAT